MKIAIISGGDLRFFGGAERFGIDVANYLKSKKFEVTVFSKVFNENLRISKKEVYKLLKTKIYFYNTFQFPILKEPVPFTFSGLKFLFSIRKYDVIYNIDPTTFTTICLLVIAKIFRKKYIFVAEDPRFMRDFLYEANAYKKLLFWFYIKIRKSIFKNTPIFQVLNKSDLGILKKLNFKGKAYVIPNFISPKINIGQVHKLKNRNFTCLYSGRLDIKHKGIDLLAKIIKKMSGNQNIKFRIAGAGGDGEQIIKTLVKKYPNTVKWLGFLNSKKLSGEYNNASLLLFTSRFESFGLSLIEGQAFGLPAIAFKVKGPDEIILDGVTGKLIEPFKISKFISAIIQYYKNYNKSKEQYFILKKRIRSSVLTRYSPDVVLPKIERMILDN